MLLLELGIISLIIALRNGYDAFSEKKVTSTLKELIISIPFFLIGILFIFLATKK